MDVDSTAQLAGGDREDLRRRLLDCGFDVVRFARIEGDAPGSAGLQSWLADGHQADMAWIERGAAKRENPGLIVNDARTMIMLGVNYGNGPNQTPDGPLWARYALNKDYHDTIKPGLVAAGAVLEAWSGCAGTDYRYYVDTGPVLERSWAAAAGIGFTGKNAMLISREYGNWLFLAAIVTRVSVAADSPLRSLEPPSPVGALCGKCTRCLDACPTGALPEPGVVDARRCISYQTIENKGVIPRELRRAIGNRLYGCDICAEVCPWNRFAQDARSVLLEARPEMTQLSLREILQLTPERFAAVFKGTAVKRLKLRGLLRNACIVAANLRAQDCLDDLVRLALEHTEPLVRAHAVWAVGEFGVSQRLQDTAGYANESDPAVLAEYDALCD